MGGEFIATGYIQIEILQSQKLSCTPAFVRIFQKKNNIITWEVWKQCNRYHLLEPVAIFTDDDSSTQYDVEIYINKKNPLYISNISISAHCISYLFVQIRKEKDELLYTQTLSIYPIHELHQYLQVISTFYPHVYHPSLQAAWNRQTRKSICSFQQLLSLPVDGFLHMQTWQLIVTMYQELTQEKEDDT